MGIGIILFIMAWRNFDGSFTNPWIIAFLFSVLTIAVFEKILFRSYKCPSCSEVLEKPQVDSERSNEYYHTCPKCDIRWYTKMFVAKD
jgi:hypothetical protein